MAVNRYVSVPLRRMGTGAHEVRSQAGEPVWQQVIAGVWEPVKGRVVDQVSAEVLRGVRGGAVAVIIRAGSPTWGWVEDVVSDTVFTATDAQVADGVWVLVREGLNGELQSGMDEIVGSAVISAGYGVP